MAYRDEHLLELRNARAMPGELLSELPLAGIAAVGGPFAAALFTWWAAMRKSRADVQIAEHASEAGQMDAMNRRFSMLMDGYEKRIGELTEEVHRLGETVNSLRTELERRVKMCMLCPMRDVKDAPDARKHSAADAPA